MHPIADLAAGFGTDGGGYAKFRNDDALPEIRIGAKEFKCVGVSPPLDHPHIFLDMGVDDRIRCPYCGTLYRYDPRLSPAEADPPSCLLQENASGRVAPDLRG